MQVNLSNNQPSFSASFLKNSAFREVVNYADKTKQLPVLDTALNNIKNTGKGDILIIHGKTDAGVYSNFSMGRRSVLNQGAKTPEEASFNGILELGELGRKFRKLTGGDIKSNLTADEVFSKYGV